MKAHFVKIIPRLAAGLAGIAFTASLAAAPDAGKGQKIFTVCAACHAPVQSAKTTGPDLRGVVGRKAGTLAGFRYSRAMKNSQWTWDEATLDRYLAEPPAALPGNAMPYPGLPDPAQRLDLIAYLKTLK